MDELSQPIYSVITTFFQNPVDEINDPAPGYFKVVKNPISLKEIKANLANGKYTDAEKFKEDFELMFRNCFMYNKDTAQVYEDGQELEYQFEQRWKCKDGYIARQQARSAHPHLPVRSM